MSSLISISKSSEDLPVAPLLVLTRTAIGLGLGMLVAEKMKPQLRQATAIALLAIGALGAAAPACVPFAAIPVTPQITTFTRPGCSRDR